MPSLMTTSKFRPNVAILCQLQSLIHCTSSYVLHFRIPPQPNFTRMSGHCMGTFIVQNLSLFPAVKCSVSHYSPPPSSSLCQSVLNCINVSNVLQIHTHTNIDGNINSIRVDETGFINLKSNYFKKKKDKYRLLPVLLG